jgi:DNA-binding NtrC family response regulator
MMRKEPTITQPRSAGPEFSPHSREELPTPVVLVVSQDSLLRWALYEALTAADLRVLTCSDQAHARDILPHVEARFSVAVVDDDTWPMTRSERDWLHLLSPGIQLVLLAHPNQAREQGLEQRIKELGLAEVVHKPFDIGELVRLVEQLASSRRGPRHLTHRALN